MLFVKAGDATPRGVLREEDYQDVKRGDRDDREPADESEDPMPWTLASARAGVRPAGQQPRWCEEDDEAKAWQPGGLARDHLELQQVERDSRQQQNHQREGESPWGAPEPLADRPSGEQGTQPPLDGVAHLEEWQERDDQREEKGSQQ